MFASLIGAGLMGCLATACSSGPAPAPYSGTHHGPLPFHRATPGNVSKILVIMEENHDAGEVLPHGMPYLWQLAKQYVYASNYNAVTDPSLPNYLAVFSGSAFNDPQDCSPGPGCTYPGPTVFGQALARGKTARAYENSMPVSCDKSGNGNYDVNHNPWPYIPSEAVQCRSGDVPAGTPSKGALISDIRAGNLPNVGLLTPNLIHDAHNGTLAQANAYLQKWLPLIMSGPDWRDGRLAIAITFDEGDKANLIPFVLMAPELSRTVIQQRLNHYALTRLIDDVIGAPPLRHAASAPDLAQVLGLKVG